jgi:hypothetical protein
LIIKTDGVSLTEQLFAMPLEDKDHQGELKSISPMNINSSTKTQQKNQEWLMKEDHATVCILISWIGQSKEKHNAKERSLLNEPRI